MTQNTEQTVYLLGAGINRTRSAPYADPERATPPLINDFFKLALNGSLLDPIRHGEENETRFCALMHYIERHWKLSEEDLKSQSFNLEECFSLIQLQKEDAQPGSEEEAELLRLESTLAALLAKYLVQFTEHTITSQPMDNLAERIYAERASVITFNYDLILERALEYASGSTSLPTPQQYKAKETIPPELLAYKECNWIRQLGYGISFDYVERQALKKRPGLLSHGEFYGHPDNSFQSPPVIKLHGSINWFQQTGVPKAGVSQYRTGVAEDSTILLDRYPWLGFGLDAPEVGGYLLSPMIITPVLHKRLDLPPFGDLWQRAKRELENCKRLVIGGYSFPPTDFHTRRLFLEAFRDHELEELVIINPDTSVVQTAKSLCHFNKPVEVCANVEEFLA